MAVRAAVSCRADPSNDSQFAVPQRRTRSPNGIFRKFFEERPEVDAIVDVSSVIATERIQAAKFRVSMQECHVIRYNPLHRVTFGALLV